MKFRKMKKNIALVALSAFIVLGIAARSVEVINRNFLFGFDHGREYLMTRDIVVNHHLTLIGTALGAGSAGINGVFHGPGYYYFLTIPYILFSGDPYGGVVLMFLFGTASLVVAFFLAREIFGTFFALVTTTLLSLSPEIISQSRSIWSPHPTTFFILLSFFFTYLMLTDTKRGLLYIFLSAFFGGFIYNFEFAIAIPITVTLCLFSIFIFKKDFKKYVALFIGFFVAYLPMLVFEIRHNFLALHGMIHYLTTTRTPTRHQLTFIGNLVDHYYAFSYNIVSSFPKQDVIQPFLLFIIFGVSLYFLLLHEKSRPVRLFIYYLILLPFLTFFVLIFLRNTVYPNYLYHLNIVYIFIFSYCIWKFRNTKKNNAGKYIFSFIFLFFLLISVPQNLKMISYDLKDYGGTDKIKGKEDAIDYIYKDAGGKKFNLLIFTPPVYTYPYDYLLNWYGNKKYGFIPGNEKKGLFYLLIQPDPAKPWSYKGWLETVIKIGTVAAQTTLPSGFIVQKRYE